jgi:eukaryotic-like serine/threonine-protein kinase
MYAHREVSRRTGRYTRGVDELTLVSGEGSIGARSAPDLPPLELPRGTTVGRYVIADVLGRGATGVVHAAYDPELDRQIALKLVPVVRCEGEPDVERSHTLREAQAMARLQHPNTVAVYDVGTHDGRVFLAMELIAGGTLAQWLATPRPWREVVDVFVQAGRGLAAAHRGGIVHRDFKPDNVLVHDDVQGRPPRVLVTDFGLARGTTSFEEDAATEHLGSGSNLRLSRTGRIAGTPAYMAPETVSGRGADERSDQFSFCVALYEALYGERPFRGETLAALALELTQGRIRDPPPQVRLPPFVRRVIFRGLSVNPEDRFANMDALLQALLANPWRLRRRVIGGACVVGLVTGAAAWISYTQTNPQAPCDEAAARLRGVWDDERRTTVEQAVLATGVVYAADTAARVSEALDRYADAWTSAATEACVASRLRPDDEADARRELCLVRLRAELAALVEVLAHADRPVVERATSAVGQLGSVDACLDPDSLERFAVPQDPAVARRVEALRKPLDRAHALYVTGQRNEAAELAGETLEQARALGYAPLLAEALASLGHAVSQADPGAAVEHLREAYWLAIAHADDVLAATVANHLVRAQVELGRHDEAHEWAAHGEAVLRRVGREHRGRIDLELNIARLLILEARYDDALARLQRVRASPELAPDQAVNVLAELGNVATQQGSYAEALAMYDEALQRAQETLGHQHPSALALVNNLAIVRYEQGDFEGARSEFSRALELAEHLWGAEHLGVAALHNNLGSVLERQGRHADALAQHERALEIRLVLAGPDSLDVAESYNNLGALYRTRGAIEEAHQHHQRALEIREAALGSDHPLFASSLANVAVVTHASGDPARARALFERAAAIQEAVLGPDHPHLDDTLTGLVQVLLELREWDAAEQAVRQTLARPADASRPRFRAEALLSLAKIFARRDNDRHRALATAKEARSLELDDSEAARTLRLEIDRFIATSR